ncbi:hypothetical protein H696_03808 [Fonticula alba]|uniref:Deoxyhypusine hydroxylase n=1 Tax=Fonticula alba TaxID=691883 RepID=A0A058Z5H7_FONAL|nr:hypothetical protein H696_03808 [Fonticula alba]KCV69376.1 hypothetical protein H696_03808 [Fonticula alba]|eukprot:XP_009495941.1 hypothetical protein H696_03808 [Fonticula alba]
MTAADFDESESFIPEQELSRARENPLVFQRLGEILADTGIALALRFRALFTLKYLGGEQAALAIEKGFADQSALLRHELAYVLGQLKQQCSLPILTQIVDDSTEDEIVRHEAGEALAAIGDPSSFAILRKYAPGGEGALAGAPQPLVDTCELAVARLEYDALCMPGGPLAGEAAVAAAARSPGPDGAPAEQPFLTIDPAPPCYFADRAAGRPAKTIPELRERLLDASLPLFDRYRALFSLRDLSVAPSNASAAAAAAESAGPIAQATAAREAEEAAQQSREAAVLAICAGLQAPCSALLRHEVAFVLGQICSPISVPALIASLQDEAEHPMVRHESAETLGSIGTPEVKEILEKFQLDHAEVVQESCQVALDMCENEDINIFNYAEIARAANSA